MKNYKKFKIIAYIILVVIIIGLSYTIYLNVNNNNEKDIKEKVFTEIKFLEGKIIDLFNSLENIEMQNYIVSVEEIPKDINTDDKSSSGSGDTTSSGGENKQNTSQSNQLNSLNSSDSSSQNTSTFQIENNGILISNEEINWDNIKKEVETLYISIPTITLDLYQVYQEPDKILEFNKSFDILTTYVKEENKEKTLNQLLDLYSYIVNFINASTDENEDKILTETKKEIFNGYILLDKENWKEINVKIDSAINIYNKLLNDIELQSTNRTNINKGYIMLNELKSAVSLQDKEIFLIKYKNLLEEINNM